MTKKTDKTKPLHKDKSGQDSSLLDKKRFIENYDKAHREAPSEPIDPDTLEEIARQRQIRPS